MPEIQIKEAFHIAATAVTKSPDAGAAILRDALYAMTEVDKGWAEDERAGVPSVTDYAAGVAKYMRAKHDRSF